MNVVLVGTAYPLRGGIAHYIGLLYRYLSQRHTVTVVTFSRQYPKFLFPGKSQDESGDAGIPLESHQWIDSINPFNWIRAGFRVRALKPDLIIYKFWLPFFAPCYGVISMIARWGRKTKSVFICDNVIPHEKRPGDRVFTKFAFRFVDGYIVQSKIVERDLKLLKANPAYALLAHPVYEIFGSEISREEARRKLAVKDPPLRIDADERVMLFFGYVRDYKGLDVLLDAMPLVLKEMKVKLLVVGEFYNDEEKYRAQVRDLALGEHVIFHADYVANEEVGLYFSASDVVTLPYKDATQSGIIQIAYNFHRPVIATDVGGLGEVIVDGQTGAIVPPLDPSALAEAITAFFREEKFESYRNNVIEEKKKYTWEHFVEGIEELYQRITV